MKEIGKEVTHTWMRMMMSSDDENYDACVSEVGDSWMHKIENREAENRLSSVTRNRACSFGIFLTICIIGCSFAHARTRTCDGA